MTKVVSTTVSAVVRPQIIHCFQVTGDYATQDTCGLVVVPLDDVVGLGYGAYTRRPADVPNLTRDNIDVFETEQRFGGFCVCLVHF